MLIVMPDARFDTAEFEEGVIGDRAEFRVYQAGSLDDVPDDVWAAADGLLIWGRTPCNAAMLDRTPKARIVVRMGVGFDAIDIEETGKRGVVACNVPAYGTTAVAALIDDAHRLKFLESFYNVDRQTYSS